MNERASISAEDAEEYTAALGQVFSGGWRLIHHAQRQGIPQALGLTTEEWVREHLGGYVRLSIPERREVVQELADDGLSQREIAAVVGVDQATIQRDLANDAIASPGDEFPRNDALTPDPCDADASPPAHKTEGSDVTAEHIREVRSEESPAYDPSPPLLSIVDLDTGEVVEPESESTRIRADVYEVRAKTETELLQERREEVTLTFVKTFSLLSSLLTEGEGQNQVVDLWEPAANTMAHVEPLAHLWTASGIRDVARRLDLLANEVDKRGGTLG